MTAFAALVLEPGTIAAWLVAGLIFAWLANKVMEEASYGQVGDFLLGSIGALAGGALFSVLREGDPGFWGSTLAASAAACILIGVGRVIAAARRA